MANQLTENQISEYKEAFNLFDKDKKGYITAIELKNVMKSLNQKPTKAELQNIINIFDTENKGIFDFSQFLNIMDFKLKENDSQEEKLKETFRFIDKDQNGYISAADLRHLMTNFGEIFPDEEINELISDVNMDGDRRISYNEFVKIIKGG